MNPKVSVLVPVYNVSRFIEKCAHSLFNQTFKDIEFIFADDCTPDNSIELLKNVIEHYPDSKNQIKIIQNLHNIGLGGTRIPLLKAARGEYIVWVDSDDFISENAIEILYASAVETNAEVVTTNCYYLYKGKDKIEILSQNLPTNSTAYIEALAYRNARASVWNTLSKRSIWIEHNLQMGEKFNIGEDYYTTVCLLYFAKNFVVINDPIYYYNLTNINAYSSGHKTEKHIQSLILLFDSLQDFFIQQNDFERFKSFLEKARMMELSSFLLHSSSELRRKYVGVFPDAAKTIDYNILPFNQLQKLILQKVYRKQFTFANSIIFIAKVLRALFKVKF